MTEQRDPLTRGLSEMFGRREGDVLAPMRLPEGTRTKVRRRQSASIAGSAIVAIALVGAATFGGVGLLRGPDTNRPADTPTVSIPSYEPGQELDWHVVDDVTTATGTDLDLAWTLRSTDGLALQFTLDDGSGPPPGCSLCIGPARPLEIDGISVGELPGGAYVTRVTDTATEQVGIEVEGGPRIEGRWMPVTDGQGHEARAWIIFLPGTGNGVLTALGSQSDGTPEALSWPPGADAFEGQVVQASASDDGLSWATRLYGVDAGQPCLAFNVLAGAPDPDVCVLFPAPGLDDHLVWAVRGGDALEGFVVAVVKADPPAILRLSGEGNGQLLATCARIPDGNGVPAGWQACVLPIESGSGHAMAEFAEKEGVFLTSRFDVTWSPDGVQVTQLQDAPA